MVTYLNLGKKKEEEGKILENGSEEKG